MSERSPCPLCDRSDRWSPLAAETERWLIPEPGVIHECRGCGIRRVLPVLAEADTRGTYEDPEYYTDTVGSDPRRVERRVRFIARNAPGRRLLDVGCGVGDIVAMAAASGFDAVGIEPSETASRMARERGLTVTTTPLDKLPAESFDVVHANHVLEHVRDPAWMAGQLYRVLAPGGLCVVEVPNEFKNAIAMARSLAGRPARRRSPSVHLTFFDPRTLRGLVQRAGFEGLRVTTWSHDVRRRPAVLAVALGAFVRLGDLGSRGQNIVCVGWRSGLRPARVADLREARMAR